MLRSRVAQRVAGGCLAVLIVAAAAFGIEWGWPRGGADSGLAFLPTCLSGGLEVADESCDDAHACVKKSARMTWSHKGGKLFAGDGTSDSELSELSDRQVSILLEELSVLGPLASDGYELDCHVERCPAAGRKLGYTLDCSGVVTERLVMRTPLAGHLDHARRTCAMTGSRGGCLVSELRRQLLGTRLSDRIARMRERLVELE